MMGENMSFFEMLLSISMCNMQGDHMKTQQLLVAKAVGGMLIILFISCSYSFPDFRGSPLSYMAPMNKFFDGCSEVRGTRHTYNNCSVQKVIHVCYGGTYLSCGTSVSISVA